MRRFVFLSLFVFVNYQLEAQINPDSFKINGLSFSSKSFQIRKNLGEPQDSFRLHYDCGGLSEAWEGVSIWCLKYQGIRFAGNQKFGFVMEKLDATFLSKDHIRLYGQVLNQQTTTDDLSDLLFQKIGQYFVFNKNDAGTIIEFNDGDHGVTFIFKNNLLWSIEYFSPC